jgi:Glycosyl hydrolase family 79 C-terminal beta domain
MRRRALLGSASLAEVHRPRGRSLVSISFTFLAMAVVVVVVALALATDATRPAAPPAPAAGPARATVVRVGGPWRGTRAIPAGFLGLSLEYSAVSAYAGRDPSAVDPVFEQLIRNLTPGQSPVLRIGGDTTDWSWYPVPGMARPAGVRINLDRAWLGIMAALSKTLDARLIMGINLEADNRRLSGYEARRFLSGIGRDRIVALEIGNEPELYGSLAWYVIKGHKYYGRPHGYDYADYLNDVARIRAVLPRVPLAGPAVGGREWMPKTARLVAAESRLAIVTLHRYPLVKCFNRPSSHTYPTLANILAPRATRGLADGVAPYVKLAHSHGLLLRIDEMNSLSCGADDRISDAFVSALWAVDALFEMARVGVDGVNIFSNPGASAQLFTFSTARGRWQAFVEPVYYGLLMFAQAAPPGSRLLRLTGAGGAVEAWATGAPDGRTRVLLINQGTTGSRVLALRLPSPTGRATVERLQAPSLLAHQRVTLGGQGFGSSTTTGLLNGRPAASSLAPRRGVYVVKLPAASAVLLTTNRK